MNPEEYSEFLNASGISFAQPNPSYIFFRIGRMRYDVWPRGNRFRVSDNGLVGMLFGIDAFKAEVAKRLADLRLYRAQSATSCYGKQKFDSVPDAVKSIRIGSNQDSKRRLKPYRCKFCGSFHIGSSYGNGKKK